MESNNPMTISPFFLCIAIPLHTSMIFTKIYTRNFLPVPPLFKFWLHFREDPSDHLIKDEKEYEKVLNKAKGFANDNKLVTFGITPTFAETGFGYIEAE